jgi:hypothetical protein
MTEELESYGAQTKRLIKVDIIYLIRRCLYRVNHLTPGATVVLASNSASFTAHGEPGVSFK